MTDADAVDVNGVELVVRAQTDRQTALMFNFPLPPQEASVTVMKSSQSHC